MDLQQQKKKRISDGKDNYCATPGMLAKPEKTGRKVKHSFLSRTATAVLNLLSRSWVLPNFSTDGIENIINYILTSVPE